MKKLRATASAIALTALLSAGSAEALAESIAYQPYQPVASPSASSVTPYGTNAANDMRNMTGNVINDIRTGTRNTVNDVRGGMSNMLGVTPAPHTVTPYTTGTHTGTPYTTGYNAVPDRTVRTRATTNGGISWGWLGLLGLIGLAGVGGRSKERDRR